MRMTTLCYIEKDDQVLMLLRNKKEVDENKGKWIGIGGKVEEGESPNECLLREVKEEVGVELTSYRFRGIVTFVSDEWGSEQMILYTADGYAGEIDMNCNEGTLAWIDKNQLMDLNLWEGDKAFLSELFSDTCLPANVPAPEHTGYPIMMKLVYKGDDLVQIIRH